MRFKTVRAKDTPISMRDLGKNITDSNVSLPGLRKAVGMVFQRPNPLPIPVYEDILFGLRVHSGRGSIKKSEADDIVEQSLREVFLWKELKEKLRTTATTLQLEQQQQVILNNFHGLLDAQRSEGKH